MQEYWEITQARALATVSVWNLQPTFTLQGLTLSQHTANTAALASTATTRAQKEGDLSDARQSLYDAFEKMTDMNTRVPGAIEGMLSPDDDLHGQIDLVYAEDSAGSQAAVLRRGRLVQGLWTDFNARRAAQTPALPPLVVSYKKKNSDVPAVDVTVADMVAMVTAGPVAQTAVADGQREVNKIKTALRALESKVDRDNKRWYQAWMKLFPQGTPEGDAAFSQVPTESGVSAPVALEIDSATANSDRTVLLTYATSGGDHATTLELQWKLESEGDFGHSTPITRPTQTVGPFPANATVTFRTRVANSSPGVVLSAPKAVAVV
jgi:hypothetical protein